MLKLASIVALACACPSFAPPPEVGSTVQPTTTNAPADLTLSSGANLVLGSQVGGINITSYVRLVPNAGGSSVTGLSVAPYPASSSDVTWVDGWWMWLTNADATNPITVAYESTGGGADATSWITTLSGHDVVLMPGDTILLVSHIDYTNNVGAGWTELRPHAAVYGPRAESSPSRSIGTAWQPNTARPTMVVASMSATCALTVAPGQAGHIDLKIGPSNPPSTVVGSVPCGNTGTVVLGVGSTVITGGAVSYIVKAGDYVEATTTNTTGTPSYTLAVSEETL